MPTFSSILADRLRRDGSRPFVTFYDHRSGERVELSVTTYANWVAKASGLLAEEADVERGSRVRIDLPPHWLGVVFVGAAWNLGAAVSTSEDPDAVICGPETLERWATEAAARPVLACSLLPLGVRFADPVPSGVHDVGAEIWSQPDAFTPWDPAVETDLATDDLTQADMWKAAADGSLLTNGGRLLSVANPASPPGMATVIEPLMRGGSMVLVRHPDPGRMDEVRAAEQVTAQA